MTPHALPEDWRPGDTAEIGQIASLKFRDSMGEYEAPGPFRLTENGWRWDVGSKIWIDSKPTHWKPYQ